MKVIKIYTVSFLLAFLFTAHAYGIQKTYRVGPHTDIFNGIDTVRLLSSRDAVTSVFGAPEGDEDFRKYSGKETLNYYSKGLSVDLVNDLVVQVTMVVGSGPNGKFRTRDLEAGKDVEYESKANEYLAGKFRYDRLKNKDGANIAEYDEEGLTMVAFAKNNYSAEFIKFFFNQKTNGLYFVVYGMGNTRDRGRNNVLEIGKDAIAENNNIYAAAYHFKSILVGFINKYNRLPESYEELDNFEKLSPLKNIQIAYVTARRGDKSMNVFFCYEGQRKFTIAESVTVDVDLNSRLKYEYKVGGIDAPNAIVTKEKNGYSWIEIER